MPGDTTCSTPSRTSKTRCKKATSRRRRSPMTQHTVQAGKLYLNQCTVQKARHQGKEAKRLY
eukprot:9136497-Prorocentrum_lima.AAC.1